MPKIPTNRDTFSKTKVVDSNSGENGGLEPCTKYSLEVTAVYKNNVTVISEGKTFKTDCSPETRCYQEEWQDTIKINQYSEEGSLKIVFTWQGCPDDVFLLKLTYQEISGSKAYSEQGSYQDGQFEVTLTDLKFCTPYTMDLVKDKTSIQRDFVSIQYPEKHGNLTDFKINMKSRKVGQYPSSTKGSITAFWVHDQACVPA